jgi:hypothetical protein
MLARRASRAIAPLLLWTLGAGVAQAQAPTLRAIATVGDPAPGGGSFAGFTVESLPILAPANGRADVAFFATLLRGRGSEGIFLSSPGGAAPSGGSSARGGGLRKIALEGDAVPGVGTLTGFGKHPIPALNESGDVVFAAAVGGGNAVEGIFLWTRGRVQTVAITGAAAPGIAGGTLAGIESPVLNDRGDVAFLATIRRGRETLDAIYGRMGGKLKKIVAQGDPAPAGGAFAGFGAPVLNNKGVVGFAAAVEGRGVPGGIFVVEGDAPRMVVGAGDDSPGGGIFYKFAERVSLNDAGLFVFNTQLRDAPTAGGLFLVDRGAPRKLVLIGDAAPGGGTFSHFGLWPTVNNAGVVVFASSVDGGTHPIGVFVAKGDAITRVAGVGDALPGGGRLLSFGLYPLAAITQKGGVSFATAVTATGEGAEGIFYAAPAGP